jgi:NADH:ubiquinone oxidoreductase subunit 6 (subunit J)
MNWHSFFFLLFGLAACAFALAMVLSNNIVRMAFYLVISLGAVAGLFFLAGADFVGAMQLMIYVGGTLVLLVFGVMLTARGPFVSMKTSGGQWALAAIVGGSLLAVLLHAATSVDDWKSDRVAQAHPVVEAAPTAGPLGLGLVGVRADRLQQPDATLQNGMSGYLLPFEVISVHLVAVLIGAAFLARARRRGTGPVKAKPQAESPNSPLPTPHSPLPTPH